MNKIKFYREQKKISQEQLASESGVSRQTISVLENSDEYDVKIGTMIAISNALGEKVQDVFFCEES